MKKALKVFLFTIAIAAALGASAYIWFVHYNYRFVAITENKVYKSAKIPPEKIEGFIKKYHIRTVIDLRDPGVQDALNPAKQAEIDEEADVISKIPGASHINIASPQVPNKRTLTQFFKVLDDKNNYPVLIHCHHGTGRAWIYSALYRIEYENWTNEDARDSTRVLVDGFGYQSSFADGEVKGDFLVNYIPRKYGSESTLNTLNR